MRSKYNFSLNCLQTHLYTALYISSYEMGVYPPGALSNIVSMAALNLFQYWKKLKNYYEKILVFRGIKISSNCLKMNNQIGLMCIWF